jgi:hypothetical protein
MVMSFIAFVHEDDARSRQCDKMQVSKKWLVQILYCQRDFGEGGTFCIDVSFLLPRVFVGFVIVLLLPPQSAARNLSSAKLELLITSVSTKSESFIVLPRCSVFLHIARTEIHTIQHILFSSPIPIEVITLDNIIPLSDHVLKPLIDRLR